jgi:hypothetical protein
LLDVEAAAPSFAGSDIGLLATGQTEEQYSGGYREYVRWEQRELERRYKRQQELDELEAEADRLEAHLVETGSLPKPDLAPELRRIQALVKKYQADVTDLPNRARRAFDYATRAQTEMALRLAQREIQRLQEEEEVAILMLLSLD